MLTDVLVLALAVGQASATFTYKDLRSLVLDNNLQSVEEVVPRLPAELRANAALMLDSRSLQGATADSPRVILFNEDASLVVSFNGDASLRGHSRFEIMTFENDRFDVKTIRFDRGPASVDENPVSCFGCHGRMRTDLHPVWDPGLIWRGAYGSHDDSFMDPASIDEAAAYTQYVAGATAHPVYKYFVPKLGQGDRSLIESRPNLRLGLLLMRQQAKRVARLLGDPRGHLRKLCMKTGAGVDAGGAGAAARVPSGSRGASSQSGPDDIASSVVANLERFLTPIYGPDFARDFRAAEAPSLIEAFEAGRELDSDEWPLTVEKQTSAVFDASFPFRDLLMAEFAKRLPEIAGQLKFKSLTDSNLKLKSSKALLAIDQLGEPLAADVCSQL